MSGSNRLLDRNTTTVEDVAGDLERYAGPVLAAAAIITDVASGGTPIGLLKHLTEAYETGEALGHTVVPAVELLASGSGEIENAVLDFGHELLGDTPISGDSSDEPAPPRPYDGSDGQPYNTSDFGDAVPLEAEEPNRDGDLPFAAELA